jgi:hypothetical protein
MIMRMLQLLVLVATGFILLAATCRPLTTKDLSELEPRIKMFKGPCFGSCPVYTLTIYEGGVVAYEGQRFTDKVGLYTKLMETNAYRELIKTFEDANMWSFQNAYKAQIPDMATVGITYYKDGDSKEVKGKDGRPAKIVELEKILTQIANGGGWEQQSGGDNHGMPEDVIADELLVSLSPEVDPSVWIIQFAKQDMRIIKRLSPNSTYWLLKFNADRMNPTEMMQFVQQDPYVLSAEFNKQVNTTRRN